jgi:hypothetical protein
MFPMPSSYYYFRSAGILSTLGKPHFFSKTSGLGPNIRTIDIRSVHLVCPRHIITGQGSSHSSWSSWRLRWGQEASYVALS